MARPGWHSRGYLPHCDADGLIQHVVFRLADSLPSAALQGLDALGQVERFASFDRLLDTGNGTTLLRSPEAARIVEDSLLWFDGERYALLAWCVMPNHVHVLIEPHADHSLSDILKSIKGYSATRINKALARSGPLWAPDYFDRFIRNDAHFSATLAYVENNPVAAGLCERPQDWAFSSAAARANA